MRGARGGCRSCRYPSAHPSPGSARRSHCHLSFDMRMSLVSDQFEIAVVEIEYRLAGPTYLHLRELERLSGQLEPSLVDVVRIEMRVPESDHKIAELEITYSGDHHREQCIRSDIKRKSEKNIGGSLVELARQFAVRDVELEQEMARRQSHLWNFAYIPSAHYQPTGVRVVFDLINHLSNLINGAAVRGSPGSPLSAVHRTEFPVLVRPFIPDVDSVIAKIVDVCLAAQKPEQLIDDRFDVELLGCKKREPVGEIKSQLVAE